MSSRGWVHLRRVLSPLPARDTSGQWSGHAGPGPRRRARSAGAQSQQASQAELQNSRDGYQRASPRRRCGSEGRKAGVPPGGGGRGPGGAPPHGAGLAGWLWSLRGHAPTTHAPTSTPSPGSFSRRRAVCCTIVFICSYRGSPWLTLSSRVGTGPGQNPKVRGAGLRAPPAACAPAPAPPLAVTATSTLRQQPRTQLPTFTLPRGVRAKSA